MSALRWSEMEGLVRVVALGVEGIQRIRPRMSVDVLMTPSSAGGGGMGVGSFEIESDIVAYKKAQRPAVEVAFYKFGRMVFRAKYITDFGVWKISPHRMQMEGLTTIYPEQKVIERLAAPSFTWPYSIERVADASIEEAKRLLVSAQRFLP